MDPASKFHWTKDPMAPHKCLACNRGADGETAFLDWNYNFDYYGAVTFCEHCVDEISRANEYVPVAEVDAIKEQNRILHERVQEVQEENGQFRRVLDSVIVIRDVVGFRNDASTSDEDSETTDSDTDEPKPRSTKSRSSRRSEIVSSVADDSDDSGKF